MAPGYMQTCSFRCWLGFTIVCYKSEHPPDNSILGDALMRRTETEIKHQAKGTGIFTLNFHEPKLNIIKALKNKNHSAAMTGDGVIDAHSQIPGNAFYSILT